MRKTWYVLLCVGVSASSVLAQRATQLPARPPRPAKRPAAPVAGAPAVAYPAPYPYAYGYSSTPAEGALNGMGNVISSKGNYNLATSEAAINMTQAQSNQLQNHMQYEDTYFQMRAKNKAYREAERGPRPTEERLARIARAGVPKPASPSEVNPLNGAINWPSVLQQDSFAADRTTLEQLSAAKAAHGSLGFSDQMAARKTIESMFAKLKSQIRDVPTQDYIASKRFLNSMIYELAHTSLSSAALSVDHQGLGITMADRSWLSPLAGFESSTSRRYGLELE